MARCDEGDDSAPSIQLSFYPLFYNNLLLGSRWARLVVDLDLDGGGVRVSIVQSDMIEGSCCCYGNWILGADFVHVSL